MEFERKGVTIHWRIENVRWIHKKEIEIYSPVFSVDGMNGTKWRLGLISERYSEIKFIIKREDLDDYLGEFALDYEFSVNTRRGKRLTVKRTHSHNFIKGQKEDPMVALSNEVTFDSITVRCKMWPQRQCIAENCHFFIQTPIRSEHSEFVREVENSRSLGEGVKKTLEISLPTDEGQIMLNLDLLLDREKKKFLTITMNCLNIQTKRYVDAKLYVLDSSGNKEYFEKVGGFFVVYARALPKNTFSLHGEITIYYCDEHSISERIECEADEAKKTDLSDAMEFLIAEHGIPCDTKLQTSTETFPVHTEVMSARSPVFEAMLSTNMKEAIQKCVRIEDVDAETVKRMLVFLYSGASEKMLEELEWKKVITLYVAADKYQILSLKEDCSYFLCKNIDLSNCIVLLHLADMHQDNELMTKVDDFIIKYSKLVLRCEQWRDLEKEIPQLAIEILRKLLRMKDVI